MAAKKTEELKTEEVVSSEGEKVTLTREELDAMVASAVDAALKARETKEEKSSPEESAAKELNDRMNEMVLVHLRYSMQQKEPVFVGVNGKTFLIKRGEDVMVPRYVKEVLDNSERQDRAVIDLIERNEKRLREM